MRSRPDGAADGEEGTSRTEEVHVEAFETYRSVFEVLTVALLLVAAGVAKKQLVWKRRPAMLRRRRRR